MKCSKGGSKSIIDVEFKSREIGLTSVGFDACSFGTEGPFFHLEGPQELPATTTTDFRKDLNCSACNQSPNCWSSFLSFFLPVNHTLQSFSTWFTLPHQLQKFGRCSNFKRAQPICLPSHLSLQHRGRGFVMSIETLTLRNSPPAPSSPWSATLICIANYIAH